MRKKIDSRLRQKIEKFKTRSHLGYAEDEIEKLVSRIPDIDIKEVFATMGHLTVLLVKGKVLYYRNDVSKAIYTILEKKRLLDEWIHYDEKHFINKHSGMIVINTANLEEIKLTDVKGYEKLGLRKHEVVKISK